MKARILTVVFGLTVLAQLYIPASMIRIHEKILAEGSLYMFKTAPIDPYNPFMGRYVRLNFQAENYESKDLTDGKGGEYFVIPALDEDGFGYVKAIAKQRPEHGEYFESEGCWYNKRNGTMTVRFPFDRYFLSEKDAPKAEKEYMKRRQDGSETAVAAVKIGMGRARLEELYIDDVPIKEFIKKAEK